jgi:hypothetical protein
MKEEPVKKEEYLLVTNWKYGKIIDVAGKGQGTFP